MMMDAIISNTASSPPPDTLLAPIGLLTLIKCSYWSEISCSTSKCSCNTSDMTCILRCTSQAGQACQNNNSQCVLYQDEETWR